MTTLILNTQEISYTLEKHGFSQEQAHGINTALQSINYDQFATKQDIARLEENTKKDIALDIADLKLNMKDMELRLTLRLGGLIAAFGTFFTVIKFFG